MYSPSVYGFPLLAISWLTTKLAVLTLLEDCVQELNTELDFSWLFWSSSTAFFLASPTGYLVINDACLVVKCLSKFDFLLCANFSWQIRQVGKPFKFWINVKVSVHSTLNSRFSSSVFLYFFFVAMSNRAPKKIFHFIIIKPIAWQKNLHYYKSRICLLYTSRCV